MFNWLKRSHKESISNIKASTVTSQKGLSTETRAWLLGDYGLVPPFYLNDYLELYLEDDLASSIIDAIARLVVSEIKCKSENDELAAYVDEFNERIALENHLFEIVRDSLMYGFCCCEVVGNKSSLLSSTEILGLRRHDPRFLVVSLDKHGNQVWWRQRPGFGSTFFSPVFEVKLDPATLVVIRNSSPFTSYGHSILQPIRVALTQRKELLAAAAQAAKSHANPFIHSSYRSDKEAHETKQEVIAHRVTLQNECEKAQENKSMFLITAGRGEYKFDQIAVGNLPDVTDLIEYLTSSIITSVGLNPSSLGWSFGSAAVSSFEASDRLLINNIITRQRAIMTQLKEKLYDLLPLIENVPKGDIKVVLEPPTLESSKTRNESESILINNIERLWRNGMISGDEGARKYGKEKIFSQELYTKMLNNEQEEENKDPNSNQALQKKDPGKSIGNNDKGTKGTV